MREDLQSRVEEVLYTLPLGINQEVVNKLSKQIVQNNLETEKKVFEELLLCCDVGYENAQKWHEKGNAFANFYGDGIKVATDARKNTYTRSIERINNQLELLKYL